MNKCVYQKQMRDIPEQAWGVLVINATDKSQMVSDVDEGGLAVSQTKLQSCLDASQRPLISVLIKFGAGPDRQLFN